MEATLTWETAAGPVEVPIRASARKDQDGDGVDAIEAGGADCDDTDPTVAPGREETTDGRDEDCDGAVDEHLLTPGDVRITELLLAPARLEALAGQWVEIVNQTDRSVVIAGWTIDVDGAAVTIAPDAPALAPGARAWLGTGTGSGIPDARLTAGPLPTPRPTRVQLLAGDVVLDDLDGLLPALETRGASWQLDPLGEVDPDLALAWCAATEPMESGDLGTPGAENGPCDTIDHDGDGLSVLDGDCDDTDPDRSPRRPEVFNLVDDNCDDIIDDLETGYDFTGRLSSDARVGIPDLGVGDLDGDGIPELVVGTETGYGRLWIFSGDALDGHVGSFESAGAVEVNGVSGVTIDVIPEAFGDLDGRGGNDLVTAGRRASGGPIVRLWSSFPTTDDPDDASARIWLDGVKSPMAAAEGDLDGDGVVELVVSDYDDFRRGTVWWMSLDGAAGDLHDTDLDSRTWDGVNTELVGRSSGFGDLDDDGYDEIMLRGAGPNGGTESTVYLLPGGARPPDSGAVADAASGTVSVRRVEAPMSPPRVGDIDGDAVPDLIVYDKDQVFVFLSPGIEGRLGTHDLRIGGRSQTGRSFDVQDIDHDGIDELIVGDHGLRFFDTDLTGEVWIHDHTVLGDGRTAFAPEDAIAQLHDTKVGNLLGEMLLVRDLDGDGNLDLVSSGWTNPDLQTLRLWYLPGR